MNDESSVRVSPTSPIEFNLNSTKVGLTNAPAVAGDSDLDLGCLFMAGLQGHLQGVESERRGVVQALGKLFGSADVMPWIELLNDDVTGDQTDGESLVFNRPDCVKFAVVFASIYGGVGDFRNVKAELRVHHADLDGPLVIPLESPDPGLRWCALVGCGMDDRSFVVVPQERYFLSARHGDDHYGFGFEWTVATKATDGPQAGR